MVLSLRDTDSMRRAWGDLDRACTAIGVELEPAGTLWMLGAAGQTRQPSPPITGGEIEDEP